MNNFITSLIRTQVPIVIGAVLAWLTLKTGVIVDEGSQAGLIQAFTAILTGLYYFVIRYLETKVPQFGWLLGLAKAPGYSAASAPPAQPSPGMNPDTGDAGAIDTATATVVLLAAIALMLLWALASDSVGF